MSFSRTARIVTPLLLVATLARAEWLGPWGTPVAPSTFGFPVALTSDGASGVLVAYQGAPVPGGEAIRVQRVLGDGTIAPGWPADGVVACSLATTTMLGVIRAVSDGSGGVYLVWNETFERDRPGTGYVQHVLADGARASGWPARGRALVASGNQAGHQALADGSGGVLVAWASAGAIRSLRILANGANAPGNPATGRVLWPALPSGATHPDFSLARDGADGYWVAAVRLSGDTLQLPSTLRLQHLDPTGIIDGVWSGDGEGLELPVPNSSALGYGVRVLADGSGGAYVLAGLLDRAVLLHMMSFQVPDPDWPVTWLDLGPGSNPSGVGAGLESDGAGGLYAVWPQSDQGVVKGALRRARSDGTLDPAWSSELRVTAEYQPTLLADAAGAYVSGTVFYSCPHQTCIGVSAISRHLPDGTIPVGWPTSGAQFSPGEYALPDSALGGPVQMVSDGAGGVFAAWTAPDVWGQSYRAAGSVRVMRFAGAGPVADVLEDARPQTIRGTRFQRDGLHVLLAGPGTAPAELAVFDLAGRRVGALRWSAQPLPRDVRVPGTDALRPGLYLVRLRANDAESHAKALVVR